MGALLVLATDFGLVKGFEAVQNGEMISHLQFADDTALFCSAIKEEVLTLKRIFRCFQLVSGLKVNFCKSSLDGVGCLGDLVRSLACIIHCIVGKLPVMYLGLPIEAKVGSMGVWNPMIEKVERNCPRGRGGASRWGGGRYCPH